MKAPMRYNQDLPHNCFQIIFRKSQDIYPDFFCIIKDDPAEIVC